MPDPRYPTLDALEQDGQPLTFVDALAALAEDTGDAPGSRYGCRHGDWAPVAAAVAVIIAAEGCEGYSDILDQAVSLTVNDHDDPAYLLVTYGPEHDLDPADYLHADDIAAVHALLRGV